MDPPFFSVSPGRPSFPRVFRFLYFPWMQQRYLLSIPSVLGGYQKKGRVVMK
jgi:hypothetical protein